MNFPDSWKSYPLHRHLRNFAGMAGAHLLRRANKSTRYIAFTGSSGKTTSRDCLAAILEAVYPSKVAVTRGNATFRLAKALMKVRSNDRFALVEIGISETGEMDRRAALVRPHIAVITKVGLAHPIGLPSLEITAREKGRLLHHVKPGGTAILNGEDPWVRQMSAPRIANTVYFGDCDGSVARARDIRSSLEDGLRFRLLSSAGEREMELGLFGTHWVNAVLGAIATAITLEIPLDTIQEALRGVYAHTARMEPVLLPNGTIAIRDEYNGSVPSFEAAIAFLRILKGKRRFVVISEIRYLEDNARERFAWLSDRIASAADGVVFVGPHAEMASAAARGAGMKADLVHGFVDLREAALKLPAIVGPGDVALFRGRSIDHLTRLIYAQFGSVGCWKTDCEIIRECDYCDKLIAPDGDRPPERLPHLR